MPPLQSDIPAHLLTRALRERQDIPHGFLGTVSVAGIPIAAVPPSRDPYWDEKPATSDWSGVGVHSTRVDAEPNDASPDASESKAQT